MEKGQKVWIWSQYYGIQETTIKSIGRKYIRVELDERIKYDINTSHQINSTGYGSYIIFNLEEYKKNVHYQKLRHKLRNYNWEKVDTNSLDKIKAILESRDK